MVLIYYIFYYSNNTFKAYSTGCVRRLGLLINQSSLLLASAALSIGLLQVTHLRLQNCFVISVSND